MDVAQPGPGAEPAAPPAAPDYAAFERGEDLADLGRSTPGATDAGTPPDPPGDQAASTEALGKPTGSDPAAPDDKKPRNLSTRKAELDAENEELRQKLRTRKLLREELATLDRPANGKPASDPAPTTTKAEWERFKLLPGAPKAEDFESYEDFVDARSLFIFDERFKEREQRATVERQSTERAESTKQTVTAFNDRIKAAREKDPEFDDKVEPDLLAIVPSFAIRPGEKVTAANDLFAEVIGSDVSSELLVHFSTPEGQTEWGQIVQAPSYAALMRMFGRVEARFLSNGTAAEPAKAPAKPVTSAPAPPTVLGTRPPANPDRIAAAVKAGDYSALEAAEDAADLARARR